jgi:hypothetical protein
MWIMSCPSTDQMHTPVTVGKTTGGRRMMPDNNHQNARRADTVLNETEVASRLNLLAMLRGALEAAGVRCLLARKHRLVLRYSEVPHEPSGMTDPQLHIFAPGGTDVATTDGAVYRLASGAELAVTDPVAAANAICRMSRATSPA